jgi:hypothetical protein
VIRRADVLAILYTSPSHTPQKPRWRIICVDRRGIGTPAGG